MIKNKKQMFLVIGVFVIILMLTTVTYAFFNYTRTGIANRISVGRISFVTRQTETINLTNVFPISSSEATGENPNYDEVVIEIVGDTDYSGGIEYLVSAVDASIYTNLGQAVPISLNIKIDDDLGTENNNYFVARENSNSSIYKRIVGDTLIGNQMLLVGYIAPNSSGNIDGIDATLTIKAYLDKDKILISDTYDGNESDNMGTTNSQAEGKTVITTSEWNSLQINGVSFKIKVEANEGIWVNPSLEEIMHINNIGIDIENGVDFSKTSDEDGLNGEGTKGVYLRSGTENDDYPIYYYRGAVEDNNVIFNNICWKAVRTTDTGGVKLIYNGESSTLYDYTKGIILEENEYTITRDDYGFTFDQNEKKYVATMPAGEYELGYFSFNVPNGDGYFVRVEINGNLVCDYGYYYIDYDGSWRNYDTVSAYPYEKYWSLGALTSSDTISFYDSLYDAENGPVTIKIQVIKNSPVVGTKCDNSGTASQISGVSVLSINSRTDSPAYVGYMYGDEYPHYSAPAANGIYYGSSFTWDGTNYKLIDPITTKNNTHHYTCDLESADGTCTTIKYYFYGSYYVYLTGGDSIETAMKKMQTNTNNSNAKTQIDNWYASNMNTVTNKLEDTIWCNDRSFGDHNNNGWIANGGDLSTDLFYGAKERSNWASNASTVKNQPSLICPNRNDAFTVNSGTGNGALTYPVALLTEDEMVLAGGVFGKTSTFYLDNHDLFWSMTPFDYVGGSTVFYISRGTMIESNVNSYHGFRPAISIKPGQLIKFGTGTELDPYVIE